MKKILTVLFLFFGFSNVCYSITQEEANAQIGALRAIKKAEKNIVNEKIKAKSEIIMTIYADTTLSDFEKDAKIKPIQEELNKLYAEKIRIDNKYNRDKSLIKKQIGKK